MSFIHVDNIIIGCGPAGLQMGYFFQTNGIDYIILERSEFVASFFKTYPKQRRLISVNKVNCGNTTVENILRYDWNSLLTFDKKPLRFSDYDREYYPCANSLVEYLEEFQKRHEIKCKFNVNVMNVTLNDVNKFIVHTSDEIYVCDRLFMATGLKPKTLTNTKLKKANLFTYDTYPSDPIFYINKNVLILGGGNAAFEVGNYINSYTDKLTICGAERFAWNTHYPGGIRSINMPILDSYYLKLKVNLDWTNKKYARFDEKYHNYIQQIENDNMDDVFDVVIYCGGFGPNLDQMNELKLDKDVNGFPSLTSFYESTSHKNLFFMGALSQSNDYKHGTSAFIHGFRYNSRLVFEHLYNKHTFLTSFNISDVQKNIMNQINTSSALLHRFDYFCDYIFFTKTHQIHYYHLPCELVYEGGFPNILKNQSIENAKVVIQVKLGYDQRNLFNKSFTQPQTGHPLFKDKSVFLHPICKLFYLNKGHYEEMYSLHLPEHAFNEFDGIRNHRSLLMTLLQYADLYSVRDDLTSHLFTSMELLTRVSFLNNK